MDVPNSYRSERRHTHELLALPLTFFRQYYRDSEVNSQIRISLTPGIRFVQQRMLYHGEKPQYLARNYLLPDCRASVNWYMPSDGPQLAFDYSATGQDIDLMNLVERSYSSDPLIVRQGATHLRPAITHQFELRCNANRYYGDRFTFTSKLTYRIDDRKVMMTSAYDASTGVRTYRPANSDGHNRFSAKAWALFYIDRRRRFWVDNDFLFILSHSVDLVSEDAFTTMHRYAVRGRGFLNTARVGFTHGGYSVALTFGLNNLNVDTDRRGFGSYRYSMLRYGITGRARLPWGFELSTSLTAYRNSGFGSTGERTNPLIWNARVSKSLLKGSLIVSADGYDILRRVSNITYVVDAGSRTDRWTNALPGYFMLSVRWNFAKKPRQ